MITNGILHRSQKSCWENALDTATINRKQPANFRHGHMWATILDRKDTYQRVIQHHSDWSGLATPSGI